MNANVPDDWSQYYRTCPQCRTCYHLSEGEGACGCDPEDSEQREREPADWQLDAIERERPVS